MAVLGLCFCARAFSSCGKRGPLFIAMRGPLTIVASLVAEHRLQMRRLSNCGSRAQLLCGMWVLPRPGLEPVSPALAGRFSTTAPPGKPVLLVLRFDFPQNFQRVGTELQTCSTIEKKQVWKKSCAFLLFSIRFISNHFLFPRFPSLNLNPVISREFKKLRGWCSGEDVAGEFAGKTKLL